MKTGLWPDHRPVRVRPLQRERRGELLQLGALANQQNGGRAIGFLNPTLYSIGGGAGYSAGFHDITSGNNFNSSSSSKYSAVSGYDLVTGWGAPKGAELINTLTGSLIGSHVLAPQNASGQVLDDLFSGTASGSTDQEWLTE